MGVFNTTQTYGGSFKAGDLIMTLNVGGQAFANGGHLTQNVNFTFSQQISFLYELGSPNIYYVGGRANGNGTIRAVAGPASAQQSFIAQAGDICNPIDVTLSTASTGCRNTNGAVEGGKLNLTFKSLTASSFGGQIAAQDVVVFTNVTFQFIDLEYNDNAAAPAGG